MAVIAVIAGFKNLFNLDIKNVNPFNGRQASFVVAQERRHLPAPGKSSSGW